jgi:putrescine transport system substrate-binding protein
MKKIDGFGRILAGAVAAAAMAVSAASYAADREVRVFNWSDYIDQEILTEFTKETGIKVVYDVFDSNEVLETKLLAGGSGYDIVVPTGSFLSRQIQAGVFQKLDKSKIPNLKHMWPEIQERVSVFDPGNEYAIDYMWGTTGLGYNEAKVKAALPDAPLDSWDLLFKPENAEKLKGCGIFVLDSPEDVIPPALNYLGIDPNTNKPEEIKKATDLIEKVRPYIQKFHSSEYINALANGDICLALGWSGDIIQAGGRAEEAKNGSRDQLHPAEGRHDDVVRHDGDSEGCQERRRSPHFPRLPDASGSHRQGFELHQLCQRQPCLAGASDRRGEEQHQRLSRRCNVEKTVRQEVLRSQDTADRHPRLDQDRHGQITKTKEPRRSQPLRRGSRFTVRAPPAAADAYHTIKKARMG